MASEPGGRADKLGNEFERLWAVRHLIELISGEATVVEIEPLGEDERGTEFWVGRPDGTREAHQCKRENGATGRWSVADLAAKRVLAFARDQLGRDPNHRFVFASGDRSPHLSDLAERSHRCDDPRKYVEYETTTSKELRREFEALCRHLELDATSHPDVAILLDYLRRFRCQVLDKNHLRAEVEQLAARWISGEPRVVVAALKDLADGGIGRRLGPNDVSGCLPADSQPRDLARDPRLLPALEQLRGRFDRSYRHLLIGGQPLGRRETDDLLARLISEGGPRLVLLHGAGGEGKSGVAFEMVDRLGHLGILCLPLRLDRDRPDGTPLQFGRSLGLPGSPADCLDAAVVGRQIGVLVLDQVDALRWTAAHSSHAWDCCETTVAEALRRPRLRVVVVCRSFDVDDDPRLKAWKRQVEAFEIKVGPLDDSVVNAVVESLGVPLTALGPGQRRVLRSPQGLYLWHSLHEEGERPPTFRTMTDLTRRFWEMIRRRLKDLPPGCYEEVLDGLEAHLDARGILAAPRTIVSRWPNEVQALISLNVLVTAPGNKLLFAHQSYLDHLTADRILRGIHSGRETILGWLARDDQGLFRRGQLRQVLALLRDDDPERYAGSMREILGEGLVRFHLQQLALQILGHVDAPSDAEVDLVLTLLERPEWAEHAFLRVVADRDAWFDTLHRRGILQSWLASKDERRTDLAIQIMERVLPSRGGVIEDLLLDRGSERWPGRVGKVIWRYTPAALSDRLFDFFIEGVRSGTLFVRDYVDWKELAKVSTVRCLRLLESRMVRDLNLAEAVINEGSDDPAQHLARENSVSYGALPVLKDAATADPIQAWDRLVPCYQRLGRLSMARRRREQRSRWSNQTYNVDSFIRHAAPVIGVVLRAAGRRIAQDQPRLFKANLETTAAGSKLLTRLMACCMSSGPDEWADEAILWLIERPARLRCGRSGGGPAYRPARAIIRRYAGLCSGPVFGSLQTAILAHKPQSERDHYFRLHQRTRREEFWGGYRIDVLQHNRLWLGQHLLLSAVPKRRLNCYARSWAGVLWRKFGAAHLLAKRQVTKLGGWVSSTIPGDRLAHLTDQQWLRIFRGDWSRRPRRSKQMGPDQLGEVSVETFAGYLGRMARLQPARFARLALRMPFDSDPRYILALLSSLTSENPTEVSVGATDAELLDVGLVEAVLRRFSYLGSDRDFTWAACHIIRKHSEWTWSDDTLAYVTYLATAHPDPLPGQFTIGGPDEPDVVMTAINCVRGSAAEAIKALLFDSPIRINALLSGINALLDDPHPAVRVAATGLPLPIFNLDRDHAIDAMLRACSHPDDRILLSGDLARFLGLTILPYHERLAPLVARMASSHFAKVSKDGAGWTAVAWAYDEIWTDRIDILASGNRSQRLGIADALATVVERGRDSEIVLNRLLHFLDDPDQEVRGTAARIFRNASLLGRPMAPSLVESFLQSSALDENVDGLLQGLEEFAGSLCSYSTTIYRLAERFAGPLAEEARDYRTARPMAARLLAKLLIRLYEQAEFDRAVRRACLDAWDRLLRRGLGHEVLQDADGSST